MLASVNIRPGLGMLSAMLEGLVLVNVILLRQEAFGIPPLYRSGVRYQREPHTEVWLTCEQVYAGKVGDCEDLCCYRVGELRVAGEEAEVIVVQAARKLYHVLVLREDGSIEDPSRILGMGRKT